MTSHAIALEKLTAAIAANDTAAIILAWVECEREKSK